MLRRRKTIRDNPKYAQARGLGTGVRMERAGSVRRAANDGDSYRREGPERPTGGAGGGDSRLSDRITRCSS